MFATAMDHPLHDQTPTSPFQAHGALHFLKKLALRGRKSGSKPKDNISPVTIPAQDFQRAHSSVDLLRKPDISHLIGFRAEDGPNSMGTNDSSRDASPSGNSPSLRPRRHSTWDCFPTAPIRSTLESEHGAALPSHNQQSQTPDDPGNIIAPPPSNTTPAAVTQPAQPPGSTPEIPPQITIASDLKSESVPDTPNNAMTRPLGDVLSHNDTLTTDLAKTSPESGIPPRATSLPISDRSSLGTVEDRPALLPHYSAPLPPPFRRTTERGLRLSPSIITRQPVPLLNLPALPPQPPVPDTPPRQRVPLRSMPSLSRHGHTNGERVDHEDVVLCDSDEEDGDEGDEEEFVDASCLHQSDDEDAESAGPSGAQAHTSSQKRPMGGDESFTDSTISPVSPLSASCYYSETYLQSIRVASSSTSLKMYPFSPDIPNVEGPVQRRALASDLPVPRARLESKPSLYRAASRSMINLGSTRRVERHLRPREILGSNPASSSGHTTESREESEESDIEAMIGRLRRRTSMPSFHPTSKPPPYPTFDPRPKESRTVSREDEGPERLPPYTNSLYLLAIMPRKMEFSSPGIQAKDRKWRRVVCELEGTVFRVYKCPPGASGGGVIGDWWEKHVGVGDMASPNPPRTRKKGPEEQVGRSAKLGVDEFPTPVTPPASSSRSTSLPTGRQRTGSQTSLTTQNTMTSTPRQAKRVSAANFLSPFRSSVSTRPEVSAGENSRSESRELELLPVDIQDSRSSLESAGRATPVAQRSSHPPQPRSASRLTFLPVATGRTQWRSSDIRKPSGSDLIRAYTLQHAESGLGNDYLKRKNVIRVRLEGEQFLLQAPDIPSVVEWIEGFHAGTNIALDIDQRPMPKGPVFPRRRRRRTRRGQAENTSRPSAST